MALELTLRRYDAVLFDLGYTLIYFDPPQEIIVQRALRDVGVERSVDEIEAAAGVVWGHYYRDADAVTFPATEEYDRETELGLRHSLLSELGLEADEGRLQIYADFLESAYKRPDAMRVYPDVRETLETLRKQGYRLGIVSNWSWSLRDRVALAGLDGFFEIVWASAYGGCNKPHPDVFLQALARMPAPAPVPNRVLYVGDSYQHDVVGARKAGLDVVLLDRNGSAGEVDCAVINSLQGLPDILEG